MANPFEALRVDPASVRRSQTWYRAQINNLRNLAGSTNKALATANATLNMGGLYLFRYDPKWKAELPYYDRLPLVLPFNTAPGGFMGINIHYMPYALRFKIMGELLKQVKDIADPQSRAKVNWNILNSASRFPGVAACVKHYLSDHVKSSFMEIPNDQWVGAAMLPIEQFTKAGKETVFKQTRKLM